MEAMKMKNILRAPKAATVRAPPTKPGDSLAVDQVIVEFE
jgi:propionyl-CoA carboxylase alpha chain